MEKNNILEMDQESEKPPSTRPQPARPWRVAVIANLKGETPLPFDGPADAGAEFDRKETIEAICDSIASDGHKSFFIPADNNLSYALRDLSPDICFNIAEGLGGDAREAQVPALLEMLRIPYTASRVLANAIALDKTMTKRIWRERGLPIAEFQEFNNGSEPLSPMLHFPLFAKPAREGTGMGVDEKAVIHNMRELRQRVAWIINEYQQPALVEEFLPGREFTIGVLGREDAILYSRRPDLYRSDGFHRFNTLEVDAGKSVTPGIYGHTAKTLTNADEGVPGFICPANVTRSLGEKLHRLAVAAHKAIGSLDVSRVDMRMDSIGQPKLIEINTLPGLTPGFSDLCVIANAEGISYRDLILEILYLGASRYKLLEPATFGPFSMETLKPRKVRESVVVR
jgi:D-alanine-D-alanine ligase